MLRYRVAAMVAVLAACAAPQGARAQGGFFDARIITASGSFGLLPGPQFGFPGIQPLGFRPFTATLNPYARLIAQGQLPVNPGIETALISPFDIPGGFAGQNLGASFQGAGALAPGTTGQVAFGPEFPQQSAAQLNPALAARDILSAGGPGGAGGGVLVNGAPAQIGAAAAPGTGVAARGSELVDARIERDGRLHIRWEGDTRFVRSITFSLLDRQRVPVKVAIVNRPPAEIRLRLTNKTAFYRVVVEYLDGTTSKVVSPL